MKKNPGRKERRRREHELMKENSVRLQHMHIVEQRKAKKRKREENRNESVSVR